VRVFAASWFFPPVTTSEGTVAYKLLRHSRHHFDVCSSLSHQWTYHHDFPLDAANIEAFPVDTEDFETWIDEAVRLFEARHAERPYDAIMTRSMPPESIEVGVRLHQRHPDIPWLASLADPVAKDPYDIRRSVIESRTLRRVDKVRFLRDLTGDVSPWRDHWTTSLRRLCARRELEDLVLAQAALVIVPSQVMADYVLDGRNLANVAVVPHTFDPALWPTASPQTSAPAGSGGAGPRPPTLAYLGHADGYRSLDPLLRALALARGRQPGLDLAVRLIGNVPADTRALIAELGLGESVSVLPPVTYVESLAAMARADWLVHVDASFGFLSQPGGSVFFAAKLADYAGTDRPILALTGAGSPADAFVRSAGGRCLDPGDTEGIAAALADIAAGACPPIDRDYRDRYRADAVARSHDDAIEAAVAQWSRLCPADRGRALPAETGAAFRLSPTILPPRSWPADILVETLDLAARTGVGRRLLTGERLRALAGALRSAA